MSNEQWLEEFWGHNRKGLDCFEGVVGRNMDLKGDSGKGLERRRTIEKSSIILENTYIMKRMLVEM